MKALWLALGAVILLGVVAGAWWFHLTRGARALDGAAATVTLRDSRADCSVRPRRGQADSQVPCDELGRYLRDTLTLRSGDSVSVAVLGRVKPEAVTAVSNELSAHGFKVAGVLRVGFITEPGPSGAR